MTSSLFPASGSFVKLSEGCFALLIPSKFKISSRTCTDHKCLLHGAAAMVGRNNFVWTRLKAAAPDCVQFKCVCHSLSLCIQHAGEKLTSNIGFLINEIPHWFSHSEMSREACKHLLKPMNPPNIESTGTDKTTPFPFVKPSVTRLLARGKVMYNILANWDELLAYFTVAEQSKSMRINARYKARLLIEMLLDKVNYLYFSFSTPIVQEFKKVNALFQQTSADPHELSSELNRHHQSLLNRLYLPNGSMKSLGDIDLV